MKQDGDKEMRGRTVHAEDSEEASQTSSDEEWSNFFHTEREMFSFGVPHIA
jgi:hypothetical protein